MYDVKANTKQKSSRKICARNRYNVNVIRQVDIILKMWLVDYLHLLAVFGKAMKTKLVILTFF